MKAVYGAPHSSADYERTAQTMEYDSERAMFEAYSKNKYVSTGVVQWMLNNAWPSMIWHLYDYYLDAGAGYFAAKKSMRGSPSAHPGTLVADDRVGSSWSVAPIGFEPLKNCKRRRCSWCGDLVMEAEPVQRGDRPYFAAR